MKSNDEILISGITFIKNGLTLGYPIKESIESISPICDEVIINVGFDDPNLIDDDGTYEYLKQSFPDENKYKFIKSFWDPKKMSEGLILSQQTNIALNEAKGKYCQYIQGDECIHENDLKAIKDAVEELESNPRIDGLVFKYVHFYGNTDIIKQTKKTYRQEIRLFRNGKGIKSWLDAQGFRNVDDSKIKCRYVNSKIYHYGWARAEQVMAKKTVSFEKLYHGDKGKGEGFQYQRVWGLRRFYGEHPMVMSKWIEDNKNDLDVLNMQLDLNISDFRLMLSDSFEYLTGIRLFEYKNFIIS